MNLLKSVDQNFCEIEGILKAETEKAILFDNGDVQAWIPRSQIESIHHDSANFLSVTIIIPEWLAEAKDLI